MMALPWINIIRFGVPILVIAVLGGGLWIQTNRLDNCKKNSDIQAQQLAACQSANATTMQTVEAMKAEISQSSATCDKRIAAKESTIKKLQKIDALKGGTDAKDSTDDAVLDALNRMQ